MKANTQKFWLAIGLVLALLPFAAGGLSSAALGENTVHFEAPVDRQYQTVSGVPQNLRVGTYTVRFDGNTATSGSMEDVTYQRFVMNTLPANAYTKEGYTFTGWSTEPVGQNLLNGTAKPSSIAASKANTGLWAAGGWRTASGGEGTREAVPLTDAPVEGVRGGILLQGTGHTDVAQDGVPVTAQKVYTYSAYVKGTGKVRLQVGTNTTDRYVQHVESVTKDWKRVSMTFILTEEYMSNGMVSVYVCTKDVSNFTVCGMKLEEGGYATDYVEKGTPGWQFSDEQLVWNLPSVEPVTLYALWAPNYCTVHFDGNGATSGSMADQYVPYGGKVQLTNNGFSKEGFLFGGWNTKADGTGTHYTNVGELSNSSDQNWNITLYAEWLPSMGTVSATKLYNVKPSETNLPIYSSQGSCVVRKGSSTYVVTCFVRNAGEYLLKNLNAYSSSIVMTDLATGEVVKHVENVYLGHANGMCYNPDTDHFYVTRYGDARWQTGIVELDWDLQEVADHEVAGAANIGNLAYWNGLYFGQVSAGGGIFDLVVLNENFEIVSRTEAMGGYEDNMRGQGIAIATDGHYIYGISADFNAPEWRKNQRLNIYNMDGSFVGMKSIAITEEVEDLSIVDGVLYATTNVNKTSNVYRLSGGLMPEDEAVPEIQLQNTITEPTEE